eukprot:1159641-Pelagomonas_calceolata.AAC.11
MSCMGQPNVYECVTPGHYKHHGHFLGPTDLNRLAEHIRYNELKLTCPRRVTCCPNHHGTHPVPQATSCSLLFSAKAHLSTPGKADHRPSTGDLIHHLGCLHECQKRPSTGDQRHR